MISLRITESHYYDSQIWPLKMADLLKQRANFKHNFNQDILVFSLNVCHDSKESV